MQYSSLPGHQRLKLKLSAKVDSGRIPHAQLFCGADGYGPLPLAIAYAQHLFCEQKEKGDSCGKCASCQRVESYNHPDLHFSFPFKTVKNKKETSHTYFKEWQGQLAENQYFDIQDWNDKCDIGNSQPIIPASEAKSISEKLALKSFEGGLKVLIMWRADLLNSQASNKLLKLIEEPPNGTVIILTSTDQDQLLKTIVSRTQLVKVNRIPDEELTEYLVGKEGLDRGRARSVVNLAEGSYLRVKRQLRTSDNELMYFNHFQTWMRLCYQKKVLETFNWSETIAGLGREHQKQFLLFCLHMARQCMLGNYTDMQMVSLQGEERAFLLKFAKFINHNNVLQLTEAFNKAHYHIERNANPKILFTDLSIKVIRLLRK